MFASNNLFEHLLRGAVGIGVLWYAVAIAESNPLSSLALGGLMLLAFRGCPICWTIGLFQTADWRRGQTDLNRRSASHRVSP